MLVFLLLVLYNGGGGMNMEFILIIIASLLLSLPLYLPGLFFASWFAFLPIYFLSRRLDFRHGLISIFIVGLLNAALSFYWLYQPLKNQLSMPFSFNFLLLLIYFIISALFISIWFIVNKFLQPKASYSPLIAALSWSCLEYLRFNFLDLNPFAYLGYTQTNFTYLMKFASFGGMFLVSFLTVLIGGYLVKIFINPSFKRAVPLLLILFFIFTFPHFYYAAAPAAKAGPEIDLLINNDSANFINRQINDRFNLLDEEITTLAKLINSSNSKYLFTAANSLHFDLPRNGYYRTQFLDKITKSQQDTYLQLGVNSYRKAGFKERNSFSLLLDPDLEVKYRLPKNNNILAGLQIFAKKHLQKILANQIDFKINPVSSQFIELPDFSYLNLITDEIFTPLAVSRVNLDKNYNLLIYTADNSDFRGVVYNNLSWSAAVMRAAESRISVVAAVSSGYSGYINFGAKSVKKVRLARGLISVKPALINYQTYYEKQPDRVINFLLVMLAVIFILKLLFIIAAKRDSRN